MATPTSGSLGRHAARMAWASVLILLASSPAAVMAQTLGVLTPAADRTTAPPSGQTTLAECWQQTTIVGDPASIVIEPSLASVIGAQCWAIYSTNGGIAEVLTTILPQATNAASNPVTTTPVAFPTSTPDTSSSSSSSNHTTKVIVPAVVGSIVGVILLIVGTLWYLRMRTHRDSQQSRARRWAVRNSGSYAMKENLQERKSDANVPEGGSYVPNFTA